MIDLLLAHAIFDDMIESKRTILEQSLNVATSVTLSGQLWDISSLRNDLMKRGLVLARLTVETNRRSRDLLNGRNVFYSNILYTCHASGIVFLSVQGIT